LDKKEILEAAATGKPLRFVFLRALRPSADLGLGLELGLGLGDPRVTQASRMGDPSVTQGKPERGFVELSLFAMRIRKWRVGVGLLRLRA
jgi:hypothetical protein